MLPFTRDQFFGVFAAYNTAIWPAQIAAYALAAVALASLWLWPARARTIAFVMLALLWAWTGAVYHIAFFAEINRAAIGFGVLFLIEAVLLLYFAFFGRSITLARTAKTQLWAWLFVIYAAAIYPLIGAATGHIYPAAPMFGVTPCPLLIFSFAVFMLAQHGVPRILLAVPLLWSAIGGSAAFLLGVVQDWALPLSAIIALLMNERLRKAR